MVEFRCGRQHPSSEDVRKEHELARAYLNFHDDAEINWIMIRAVEASVASVVIVPLQDVLGLAVQRA